MKYKIIQADTIKYFTQAVNKRLSAGWVLHGDSFITEHDMVFRTLYQYYQPMTYQEIDSSDLTPEDFRGSEHKFKIHPQDDIKE